LLQLSNIPIEISVRENEQVLASKNGGAPYSVAELSDGERNALLIAAEVLTVKPGTLILIDEPERHLHRSIISPLLTHLFSRRTDCAFVVSTHDVMLPLDNPSARSLLIRSCLYNGSIVRAWEADLISSDTEIDGELKKDILGARRKILFIEGTEQSLDKPLYSLIFPNVSIVAKSSCRDVENAVSGIRGAAELNWLNAFGIVDNDRRTQADIERLKAKGVYAVSVYSVESIYYHPEIQSRVAALITTEDVSVRVIAAKEAAIAALRPEAERLSGRAIEKTLPEQVMQHVSGQPQIAAALPINISLDIAAVTAEEKAKFQAALDCGDVATLIEKYPIRETPAMSRIANSLGFRKQERYESAVRKLLMEDAAALAFVRSLFGTLEVDLATA
jgi:tRNA threonylcarbamoyladenosine modification (KEOPS) complex Cgi121 subunit